MAADRASRITSYRARIARYKKLIAGFHREVKLVTGDRLLDQYERDEYLAAVSRILRSLAEAEHVLAASLVRVGDKTTG